MNAQTFTVQVPASLGRLLIAPALPRLLLMHPELRVTLIEVDASSGHWVREADAAVCIGPGNDPRRVVRQLGVVHAVTCASVECVERAGTPQAPSDLAPGDCIGLLEPRTRRPQEWRFRRGGARHELAPAAPLAFTDPESAIAAAVHGGGYVRVLSIEADQQIAGGLLRPVLADWNDERLPITLVGTPRCIARPRLTVFSEFVAGLLPSPAIAACSSAGGQLARAAASPAQ